MAPARQTAAAKAASKLLGTREACALYEEERRRIGREPYAIAEATLRVHVHNGRIEAIKPGPHILLFEPRTILQFAQDNRLGRQQKKRAKKARQTG